MSANAACAGPTAAADARFLRRILVTMIVSTLCCGTLAVGLAIAADPVPAAAMAANDVR